jgi:hypothetical protein
MMNCGLGTYTVKLKVSHKNSYDRLTNDLKEQAVVT